MTKLFRLDDWIIQKFNLLLRLRLNFIAAIVDPGMPVRGRRDKVVPRRDDRRLPVDIDPAPQAVRVNDLAVVKAGQGAREVAHILDGPVGGPRVGFKGAVEQRHGYVADFIGLIGGGGCQSVKQWQESA